MYSNSALVLQVLGLQEQTTKHILEGTFLFLLKILVGPGMVALGRQRQADVWLQVWGQPGLNKELHDSQEDHIKRLFSQKEETKSKSARIKHVSTQKAETVRSPSTRSAWVMRDLVSKEQKHGWQDGSVGTCYASLPISVHLLNTGTGERIESTGVLCPPHMHVPTQISPSHTCTQ